MKTLMALLIVNDGSPIMTHRTLAKLRGKSPRTLLNELSARRNPIPMWKDGGDWICTVADVAAWIDRQREQALTTDRRLQDEFGDE